MMKANRTTIIALVCLVAIIVSVIILAKRPPSDRAKELDKAGWRMCAACGHVWHAKVPDLVAQSKANPEGTGWVKCPNCGAWKGMPMIRCPACGKPFTAFVEVTDAHGGVYYPKQRVCPHCGHSLSEARVADEEPAEPGADE